MLNGFLSPALNQRYKIIGVFDADSKAQQAFMISIWLMAATTELIYVPSRMGGISDSLEHQDLRLCQKALSFRRKFYFALFLLKLYNLIQNLYTLRYYLTFNFAAHSSSG